MTNPDHGPILEARNLNFFYERIHALRNVTLAVGRNRNLAVVGANGSGKSTLFLHLNGSLGQTSDRLFLDGRAVGSGKKEISLLRRSVGLVFQNPEDQLFAATVFQDVSFGPLNLGKTEAEATRMVTESLAWLGISDLSDRPTHHLSFGQKKRVALAGVLAMEPAVLLLDEPTSGLDHQGELELLAILERLKARGITLVMATHDMDLAWEWADEMLVMKEGEILARGEPEKLFRDAGLMETAGLAYPRLFLTARRLAEAGVFPNGTRTPRTFEEMRRLIPQPPVARD